MWVARHSAKGLGRVFSETELLDRYEGVLLALRNIGIQFISARDFGVFECDHDKFGDLQPRSRRRLRLLSPQA